MLKIVRIRMFPELKIVIMGEKLTVSIGTKYLINFKVSFHAILFTAKAFIMKNEVEFRMFSEGILIERAVMGVNSQFECVPNI